MPFFQATQIQIVTGASDALYYAPDKVQSIEVGYTTRRESYFDWNRFSPTERRPVSEPHQINCNVSFIKGNKDLEFVLGLVSGVSILSNLRETSSLGTGVRHYNLAVRDSLNVFNPSGAFIQLKSGVLTNFSLSASVGDTVKGNFGISALEAGITSSLPAINTFPTGQAGVIRQEGARVSMLALTGLGINDLTLQSFSLNLPIERLPYLEIGDYYPQRRDLVNPIVASIQFNGYTESFNTISNLRSFTEKSFVSGDLVINLTQHHQSPITTTYTISNPYVSAMNIQDSENGYNTVDVTLEIPLDIENITSNKSNLRIT